MTKSKLTQEDLDEMIADEALLDLALTEEGDDLAADDDESEEIEIRICTCTAGNPDPECDFESHRPGMNDPARPFAGLTIDNSNPETTEAATVKWLQSEYAEGRKAGQRWLTEHNMTLDDTSWSAPTGVSIPRMAGFSAIVETWQKGDCPQGWTQAHLMRQLHLEFSHRRLDAATALSADSAEASMNPLGVGHWDAEEIATARAVIEDWARWTGTGWSPFLERSVQFEVESWKADAREHKRVVLQDDAITDKVRDLLKEWACNAELTFVTGERTQRRNDISLWLGAEMQADALQLVFVNVPTGSRAALRGERVWAIAYYPSVYTRADGSQGSGWFNLDGYAGVARSWTSLQAAKDDYRHLLDAVLKIRRHSKQQQLVQDEEPDWFTAILEEEAAEARPTVTRSNVPTL